MGVLKHKWSFIVTAALLVAAVLFYAGSNFRVKTRSDSTPELATSSDSGGNACCDKPPSRAGYFKAIADPTAK
ncbi:MAG: hypothetical protein ORN83_05360 [Chthoniobacteraceae bacterium]|nr:hypothetical protein [Chthoniobacteraceae bacterium]